MQDHTKLQAEQHFLSGEQRAAVFATRRARSEDHLSPQLAHTDKSWRVSDEQYPQMHLQLADVSNSSNATNVVPNVVPRLSSAARVCHPWGCCKEHGYLRCLS